MHAGRIFENGKNTPVRNMVHARDLRAVDADEYFLRAGPVPRAPNRLHADAFQNLRIIRPGAKRVLQPADFQPRMVLPAPRPVIRHRHEKIAHQPLCRGHHGVLHRLPSHHHAKASRTDFLADLVEHFGSPLQIFAPHRRLPLALRVALAGHLKGPRQHHILDLRIAPQPHPLVIRRPVETPPPGRVKMIMRRNEKFRKLAHDGNERSKV